MLQPRCRRLAIALILALTTPVWAGEPDAATRSAARKLATEGVTLLQQGNSDLASTKLEKAFELLQASSIALWSARALAKRGKLVEASERYLQAGRLLPLAGNEQAVQLQAQKDAARELSELAPRIPKLVIAIVGAEQGEVQVMLDGKAVPSALFGEEQLINPGAHAVVGARGSEQVEQAITLSETQKAQVMLRFRARSAPHPASPLKPEGRPQLVSGTAEGAKGAPAPGQGTRTFAYVSLAAGGVGLLTGGVTGLLALGKRNNLDKNPDCQNGKCLPSAQGEVDSFRALRTASTIAFVGGGALAATGLVLLFTSPPKPREQGAVPPVLALRFAPTAVSFSGSF